MSLNTFIIKVFIIATWICLVALPANSSSMKGPLPSLSVVANFLNTFIKPLMELDHPSFRTIKDVKIEKVINEKIEELRPYLQDEDVKDNQIDTENDTTIIDFVPAPQGPKSNLRVKTEKLQHDIKRYNKLRKKITKALDHESISANTKSLIQSTLDDMVLRIIDNKCNWKSVPEKKVKQNLLRLKKKENYAMTLANVWEQLWKMVFKASDKGKNESAFLDHFNEFVTKVINDTGVLKDNIHFICEVLDKKDKEAALQSLNSDEGGRVSLRTGGFRKMDNVQYFDNHNILRGGSDMREENAGLSCESFKVCSNELRNFMRDFYTYLNDTAVATLTNYAEMFLRDVSSDSGNEKGAVIKNINRTSDIIKHKISVIFEKQTQKLKLDKHKNKEENIYVLKSYVQKSVNHVKKQIMTDLSINLNNLRPKLLLNIQKDIEVNMDVDLGNLERELSSKVCMVFATCNGKFVGRRRKVDGRTGSFIDKNSVYVQIQMTLDDDENVKKPIRRIGLNVDQAMREINNNIALIANDGTPKNFVTRTTIKDRIKTGNEIESLETKRADGLKKNDYKLANVKLTEFIKSDISSKYLKPTYTYNPKESSIYPHSRNGTLVFYRHK